MGHSVKNLCLNNPEFVIPMSTVLARNTTGVASMIDNLIAGFDELGIKCDVLLREKDLIKSANFLNIHSHIFKTRLSSAKINARLFDLTAPIFAKNDKVILWPNYMHNIFFNQRSVVFIHDLQHVDIPQNFKPLRRAWLNLNMTALQRQQIATIFISGAVQVKFQERFGSMSRSAVINNAINLSRYAVSKKPELPIPDKYVIYVGHDYPHKRISLLKKVGKFLAETSDVSLVIAGRDHFDEDDYGIYIVASPSDAELSWLYKNARLFVSASEYEGFGMPMIEALALGLPVIATENCATETLTDDGVLVLPRDITPEVFCKNVLSMITEKESYQQRLSHMLYAANFAPATIANKLIEFVKKNF